jgi:hypothetical protein
VNYGGRGIGVCERWHHSFVNFIADMGPKPTPTHTIERIDNDGNYEPSNCRWATRAEQNNNKRDNRIIEYNGQSLNVSQWATVTGLEESTIRHRLDSGWSIKRALTAALRKNEHILSIGNESHTIVEWAKIMGIEDNCIVHRLKRGWPVEQAVNTPVDTRYHPEHAY